MPTFTTSDGVRLNYADEGAGTPVVLLAGFCAPLESWELQRVEALGRPLAFADPSASERRVLLQNHAEQDWRDVVARIEVPSLFLVGGQSQFWPASHAEGANTTAQVVTFGECGHAVNFDQPDRANTAILEFLT